MRDSRRVPRVLHVLTLALLLALSLSGTALADDDDVPAYQVYDSLLASSGSVQEFNARIMGDLAGRWFFASSAKQESIPVVQKAYIGIADGSLPKLLEDNDGDPSNAYTAFMFITAFSGVMEPLPLITQAYTLVTLDGGDVWDTSTAGARDEYRAWYEYFEGASGGSGGGSGGSSSTGNQSFDQLFPNYFDVYAYPNNYTTYNAKEFLSGSLNQNGSVSVQLGSQTTAHVSNNSDSEYYLSSMRLYVPSIVYEMLQPYLDGNWDVLFVRGVSSIYVNMFPHDTFEFSRSDSGQFLRAINKTDIPLVTYYAYFSGNNVVTLDGEFAGMVVTSYGSNGTNQQLASRVFNPNSGITDMGPVYYASVVTVEGGSAVPVYPTPPTEPTPTLPTDGSSPTVNVPLTTQPTFEGNGTGTTTVDLTPILEALRSINTNLTTGFEHFEDVVNDQFSALQSYLQTWFEWWKTFFTNWRDTWQEWERDFMRECKRVTSWLERIYYKSGSGTASRPDPSVNPVSTVNWWDNLGQKFLSMLPAAVSDIVSQLSRLNGVFPFSIPWDVGAILGLFSQPAATPVFDLTIPNVNGTTWTARINLSQWNAAALVIRRCELFVFAIQLMMWTPAVIKQLGVS